jgi:hypothetical protein
MEKEQQQQEEAVMGPCTSPQETPLSGRHPQRKRAANDNDATAPLQQEQPRQHEEAWEVCLSTHMLAGHMNAPDLARLSMSARGFLPFATQIWYLKVKFWTPAILSKMQQGGFTGVTALYEHEAYKAVRHQARERVLESFPPAFQSRA